MTHEGVESVLEFLEANGFERLPKPLVVAGSTFDFDAAAKGLGVSHDLVVVALSSIPPRRLVRLLSGLAGTLDQVESRRPVSLVLLGEQVAASTIAELERYARVMRIENEAPDPGQIRRAVEVLLPLALPEAETRGRDPLEVVARFLGTSHSSEHQLFIDAARIGPDEVRDSFRKFIDGAADGGPGGVRDL